MSYTSDPAKRGVIVTPADGTVLDPPTRALYIGGTGNINVRMVDGMDLLLSNVPVGILPLRVDKVYATNTTATLIAALS